MVSGLFCGTAVRSSKLAIAAAFAADPVVSLLVPAAQIFSVERATIPKLPSVEIIGISSERQSNALIRHAIQVEVTVSATAEDAADEALDGIVRAIRRRLSAAENSIEPISLAGGVNAVVSLASTRWSVSATASSGTIRGASVAVTVEASE